MKIPVEPSFEVKPGECAVTGLLEEPLLLLLGKSVHSIGSRSAPTEYLYGTIRSFHFQNK